MARQRQQVHGGRGLACLSVLAVLAIGIGGCGNQAGEPSPEPTVDASATATPEAVTPENTTPEATPDSPAQPPLKDTVVVPGERVGPVTSDTSRAELGQMLGESILEDQAIDVGEGFTEPGTVVDLGDGKHFTLVWQGDSRERPLMAMDFGPAWTTPEGIGVGSSLEQLQTALGEFQLYGFGWDYEGTLVLEGSQFDAYHGDLFLRIRPDPKAIESHEAAYKALLGDAVFVSDNPNLEPLQPQVYAMVVYLNPLSE